MFGWDGAADHATRARKGKVSIDRSRIEPVCGSVWRYYPAAGWCREGVAQFGAPRDEEARSTGCMVAQVARAIKALDLAAVQLQRSSAQAGVIVCKGDLPHSHVAPNHAQGATLGRAVAAKLTRNEIHVSIVHDDSAGLMIAEVCRPRLKLPAVDLHCGHHGRFSLPVTEAAPAAATPHQLALREFKRATLQSKRCTELNTGDVDERSTFCNDQPWSASFPVDDCRVTAVTDKPDLTCGGRAVEDERGAGPMVAAREMHVHREPCGTVLRPLQGFCKCRSAGEHLAGLCWRWRRGWWWRGRWW